MRTRPIPAPAFRSLAVFGAVVILGGAAIFAGCSKQGEGERCSTENGNLDCVEPLMCAEKRGVHNFSLCCPVDPLQAAKKDICGPAGALPTDGAVAETSSDGATDGATDGGSDSDALETSDGVSPDATEAGDAAEAGDTTVSDVAADG